MKHLLALSIAALALVAARFGSDNSGSSSSSSSGSSDSSSSTSSSSGSSGAAKSAGVAIDIKGFAFNPSDITVKKGAKIPWTNSDSVAPNVVAGDGTFKSGSLNDGVTFSWPATKAGQWDYLCPFHPNMKAPITVTS